MNGSDVSQGSTALQKINFALGIGLTIVNDDNELGVARHDVFPVHAGPTAYHIVKDVDRSNRLDHCVWHGETRRRHWRVFAAVIDKNAYRLIPLWDVCLNGLQVGTVAIDFGSSYRFNPKDPGDIEQIGKGIFKTDLLAFHDADARLRERIGLNAVLFKFCGCDAFFFRKAVIPSGKEKIRFSTHQCLKINAFR